MLNVFTNRKPLPDQAAFWSIAILAVKDAGKTYAAADIAEEMVKQGVPIIVIDTMGIWWGLRVGVEGHAGLPVVVFGGQHKDIAIPTTLSKKGGYTVIDEDRLKQTVKAILEAGINAVLDTSEFSQHMQRRCAAIFLNELFHLNAPYGLRHVFIEEADLLAPQRATGEMNVSLGAVDNLVRRGGNFNLGVTVLSQRSAVLNKDVLTQCNLLVVMRIGHKLDKDAVRTWVANAVKDEKEERKLAKWYDTLRKLHNGEGWIYAPEKGIELTPVKFRKRETLHATRQYFLKAHWEQKNVKPLDVDEFVTRFKSKFEPKLRIIASQTPRPAITPFPELPASSRQVRAETSGGDSTNAASSSGFSFSNTPHDIRIEGGQYDTNEPVAKIMQSLPSISLEQYKPTVGLSVEMLDQPTTTLGRVCVVLKNNALAGGRNDTWSKDKIKTKIREHSWDENGVEEAIEQLIRWEILQRTSSGQLKFDPKRIQITERQGIVGTR